MNGTRCLAAVPPTAAIDLNTDIVSSRFLPTLSEEDNGL